MADKKHVNSNSPDPQGWYSDRSLLIMLGIGYDVQRKAREAGHLKFRQAGTSFLYKWPDVNDWLENGAKTDKQAAVPQTALEEKLRRRSMPGGSSPAAGGSPPASVSNSPSHTRNNTTMPTDRTSATTRFHEAVEAEMAKGKTRSRARQSVLRSNSGLQRALLIEGNRNKPKALPVIDELWPG